MAQRIRQHPWAGESSKAGTGHVGAGLKAALLAAAVALILPIASTATAQQASMKGKAVEAPPPSQWSPELQATPQAPEAVVRLRRAMLNGDVNTLTFRNMDELFYTRVVGRSGPVWQLPRQDHNLDFTYSYKGKTYTPEEFLDRTYTNALLVMKDGNIVKELYRNNTNEQTHFMSWSMSKSITSILVGAALQEGRIKSLDDQITAYLPELKGGGYDGVSVRQILQMRSGVDYEERYDFRNPGVAAKNHEFALVRNAVRFVDAARTVKRAHPPGKVFQYKTIDTAVLGWLIERVSGGSSIAAYASQRLWEPLGAEANAFYVLDGAPGVGREFNGAGYNATLRDYGRIGQMMLNGGVADGRRLLSEEWVRESTKPEGQYRGYGYQWWTFDKSDSYAAIGLQGQYIFIDPATKTVIVKLSYFPPGEDGPEDETAAFLLAASAWNAK